MSGYWVVQQDEMGKVDGKKGWDRFVKILLNQPAV